MRNLKTFGLAAMAAMALMVFAASPASAAGGGLYNGATRLGAGAKLDWSLEPGWKVVIADTSGNALDECTGSTVQGELTNAGSATVNPTGTITALTWTGCTFTTTTLTKGKLQIESSGGTNGVVKSDASIEVTINTGLFGSCIYGVAGGVTLGTIESFSSGSDTFKEHTVYTRFGSNFACPTSVTKKASYVSTEPSNLRVEAS